MLTIANAQIGNLNDLLTLMHRHIDQFDAAHDHRAAFLRVYATMTAAVADRMDQEVFLDPPWLERVAIRFAWWYFDALARYERADSPPPAWAYAFDIARRKQGFLLQDILLGMNAHINNDLPLVVAQLLHDEGDDADHPRRTRRRFDHDQINRVLYLIIPEVERVTAAHYGRLILPLGRVLGTLDQALSLYGLRTWRDNVWRNAAFLLAARDDAERIRVIRMIQEDALHVAKSIERFPVLRHLRPLAPLARRFRLC